MAAGASALAAARPEGRLPWVAPRRTGVLTGRAVARHWAVPPYRAAPRRKAVPAHWAELTHTAGESEASVQAVVPVRSVEFPRDSPETPRVAAAAQQPEAKPEQLPVTHTKDRPRSNSFLKDQYRTGDRTWLAVLLVCAPGSGSSNEWS